MAASAWVASAALCLRTRSMTLSSASLSDCGVDDVEAIAAGVTGLRAGGGKAACWRVAGARVAGAAAGATTGALAEGAGAAFTAAALVAGFGTALRAIGRG